MGTIGLRLTVHWLMWKICQGEKSGRSNTHIHMWYFVDMSEVSVNMDTNMGSSDYISAQKV